MPKSVKLYRFRSLASMRYISAILAGTRANGPSAVVDGRSHALPAAPAFAVSIALVLYYVFNGDIQWYGWFTIAVSAATLAYTTASLLKSREEKKKERDHRRGQIRRSIREAEIVFRDMSALSND